MSYSTAQLASFVGLQVVDGKLAGRSGRFVLQLNGSFHDGTAEVTWTVVTGSGTGELAGLSGTGGYVAGPGDFPNIPITLEFDVA